MRILSLLNRLALAAISVAAPALRAQVDPPAPTFANVTVHDPSVVKDGSTFYVFGSHLAAASTTNLIQWSQIPSSVTSSSLVKNGTPLVEFAAALAYSTVQDFWAPDAIKLADGKYYTYYCTCQGSSPLSALGLAKADAITGPYANVGILLKSAGATPTVSPYNVNTMPNVVDPSVFYDNNGVLWMVYGSFSGGIFILQLDSNAGSPTIGQPLPGQGYGKKLIGGNSSRIEGAYIIYNPDTAYYYLFMTFGGLDANGGYNIRVGRSPYPDGPYFDAAGHELTNVSASITNDAPLAPYGVKLMGNYQFLHVAGEPGSLSRGYVSPGGTSVIHDPATGKYLMVIHTRFVGQGEVHEVRVFQLYFNSDGWPVAAPQRYAGETMSPTDVGRVVGNYKLINHGNDTTATVKTSTVISLLADGTVTGSTTGTWQLSGTNDVTLVLAGVTYQGVLSRQWDDDTQVWVLDFTALASSNVVLANNNVAVWGSKVAINTAPVVLTNPAGQTVTTGNSATFTAMVSGDPLPNYQWKKDGADISGATNSSYTIANVGTGDASTYTLFAINSAGNTTSTGATLTVNVSTTVPGITTQPVSQTVAAGALVTFTAAASGNPAPTYQWKKNGADIPGATNASYTINAVAEGDAGSYTVLATNSVGSSLSNPAGLTVIVPPSNAVISIMVQ